MSLVSQLNNLITRIGTEIKTMKTQYSGNNTGNLSALNTTDKTSLLAAINEVKTQTNGKQANLVFTPENAANKGIASGYAGLDGSGKVPMSQLPAVLNSNKGYFTDLAALATAYPSGSNGDYVILGSTDTVWLWDSGTTAWVETDKKGAVTSVNGSTGAVVIADVLAAGASGLMSGADKTKLNGIASGATANDSDANLKNRANHTGSQLAATISDFAATVLAGVLTGFVTTTNAAVAAGDTIVAAFGKIQAQINGHFGAGGAAHANAVASGAAGFMTGADKTKLDGVATGANNYVHPTTDGSIHLPANGTTNQNKVPKASVTPGSFALGFVDFSELASKPITLSGYGIADAYTKTEIGDPATDFVTAFNAAIV